MGSHTDGTTVKGCQTLSAGGGSLKTGKGRVALMLRVCEPRRVGVAVYLYLVLSVRQDYWKRASDWSLPYLMGGGGTLTPVFCRRESQVSEKPNNLHETTEPVKGKGGLCS